MSAAYPELNQHVTKPSRRHGLGSVPPDKLDAVGVEGGTATAGGLNDGPVEAVVESGAGRDLTLRINGRSVKVRVTPETPLVMPIAAARADLVPGAAVFINATPGANGQLSAARVVVGKDGVAPPT